MCGGLSNSVLLVPYLYYLLYPTEGTSVELMVRINEYLTNIPCDRLSAYYTFT